MPIKVKLGDEKDFEAFRKTIKHHDQKTLWSHWTKVRTINKQSSNQWFLALNHATPFSSIVSVLPLNVLPSLEKTIPHRWKRGTVYVPTPRGECLVFGEVVIRPDEVGVLHSGDSISNNQTDRGDYGAAEEDTTKPEAIHQEDHPSQEEPKVKRRGRPKGWRKK